jgi:Ca-activated chloride channel family protein
MRRNSSFSTRSLSAALGALLMFALLFAAPQLYAQSGRIKQPAKPATPSTGGARPKRASTSNDSQKQTPTQTTAPTVHLPSGTVVMDEAPPPPRPTPTPTPAANTSSGEEVGVEDVVRITSNLVTVPATVIDAQGRAVVDLKLEDFELRVDGQPKPISDLNRSEVPVTLALLFDNSSSLTSAREFEKQAAVKFFRSVIRPIDRAAIYSVATDVDLVQPLTNSVPALVRTVEHFGKPEGATKLLDAIADAANYLRPYPGRKVIVIVSDGEDTLSDLDFDTTLRRVLAADCQVYAVQTKQIEYAMLTGTVGNANIRTLAAERRLQDLTAHTGGAVYTPIQTADLDVAFTQISADLAQQYVLSYYPTDDDRSDGRFRVISVRISTRPNIRVRARRGYYPRRPNERISYNTQLPAASEPVMNSNQRDTASRLDSSQTDSSRTDSLPPIASNSAVQKVSGNAPARTRRGPSETSDEPDTGGSVGMVASVEEPVVRRDKETVKASEPQPPPKPAPDTPPPASSNKPPVLNSSPTVSTPTPPAAKPVSGGVLNGKAISLPKPLYPSGAKMMRTSGVVTVEVLLNEEGKVISARAVDGNTSLRQAAVDAARLARFSPTILSGQPVKVAGFITYKFTLAN